MKKALFIFTLCSFLSSASFGRDNTHASTGPIDASRPDFDGQNAKLHYCGFSQHHPDRELKAYEMYMVKVKRQNGVWVSDQSGKCEPVLLGENQQILGKVAMRVG